RPFSVPTSPKRSERLQSPTISALLTRCRKRGLGRSCGGFCERLRRVQRSPATLRRWKISPCLKSFVPTRNRIADGNERQAFQPNRPARRNGPGVLSPRLGTWHERKFQCSAC